MTPEPERAELLAEIDRLRALPVLRTCGDCRYHLTNVRAVAQGAAPWVGVVGADCSHEDGPEECDASSAPPSTCPLRGRS